MNLFQRANKISNKSCELCDAIIDYIESITTDKYSVTSKTYNNGNINIIASKIPSYMPYRLYIPHGNIDHIGYHTVSVLIDVKYEAIEIRESKWFSDPPDYVPILIELSDPDCLLKLTEIYTLAMKKYD